LFERGRVLFEKDSARLVVIEKFYELRRNRGTQEAIEKRTPENIQADIFDLVNAYILTREPKVLSAEINKKDTNDRLAKVFGGPRAVPAVCGAEVQRKDQSFGCHAC